MYSLTGLLERVQQGPDTEAWTELARQFRPLLYSWARKWRLQDHDADDFVQQGFLTLLRQLPRFRYDPSRNFHGWLKTVVINQWRDECRRQAREKAFRARRLVPARGEEDWIEAEHRQTLLDRAFEKLKAAFQSVTWQAFWEHGQKGRPADEVARELGITPGAVYAAKFRILDRIRQFVQNNELY